MKLKYHVLMLIFVITSLSCKNERGSSKAILLTKEEKQLEVLGQKYFDIWTATQAVGATEKDIENYLDLLVSDIGHQHFPYDKDDSR